MEFRPNKVLPLECPDAEMEGPMTVHHPESPDSPEPPCTTGWHRIPMVHPFTTLKPPLPPYSRRHRVQVPVEEAGRSHRLDSVGPKLDPGPAGPQVDSLCDPITLLPFCGTEEQRNACLQWQGEGPDPWEELRQAQHSFLEGKLKSLLEKCQEAEMEERMSTSSSESSDTAEGSPTFGWQLNPGQAAQDDLDHHVEDHGGEEMLEPAPKAQCQEAPMPDLTTTSYSEPSTQGDTVSRVPVLVGEADPLHRLDLQDTKPELETVPAAQGQIDLQNQVEVLEVEDHSPDCAERRERLENAPKKKRGWLRHLLSCFRRKARKQ